MTLSTPVWRSRICLVLLSPAKGHFSRLSHWWSINNCRILWFLPSFFAL